MYNGKLVKELEELVFDEEKVTFKGRELKLSPVPIGSPKKIDIHYPKDIPYLIMRERPEKADAYAMEKRSGLGWTAIQYYRIIA